MFPGCPRLQPHTWNWMIQLPIVFFDQSSQEVNQADVVADDRSDKRRAVISPLNPLHGMAQAACCTQQPCCMYLVLRPCFSLNKQPNEMEYGGWEQSNNICC